MFIAFEKSNTHIKKISASSWLYLQDYTRRTVNKTLKKKIIRNLLTTWANISLQRRTLLYCIQLLVKRFPVGKKTNGDSRMNRRLNDVPGVSNCMEGCSHLRKVNVAGQFASFSALHSDSHQQDWGIPRNTPWEHSLFQPEFEFSMYTTLIILKCDRFSQLWRQKSTENLQAGLNWLRILRCKFGCCEDGDVRCD